MKKRPRVLYVVFNEAFWAGVVYTQATEMVRAIQELGQCDVMLLVFVPVISLWLDRASIWRVRKQLTDAGATIGLMPTPLYFSRYLLPRLLLIPVYALMIVPVLGFCVLRHRVDLLHPRGYMAGLGALIASRVFSIPFVFDPRSPFPEENARSGNWKRDSWTFRAWKRFEGGLVRYSAATVVTSEPFGEHLRADHGEAKYVVVPNNSAVRNDAACDRRTEQWSAKSPVNVDHRGADRDRYTLAYVGTIGKWNAPRVYAGFHKRMIDACPRLFFLYVVSYGVEPLTAELNNLDVPTNSYTITSVRPDQVYSTLQGTDAGLQLMAEPDVRLGVKIADYLVAGLPVVVNTNALGAASLVAETGAGRVIDLDSEFVADVCEFLRAARRGLYSDAVRRARGKVSTTAVTDKYLRLYGAILDDCRKEKA